MPQAPGTEALGDLSAVVTSTVDTAVLSAGESEGQQWPLDPLAPPKLAVSLISVVRRLCFFGLTEKLQELARTVPDLSFDNPSPSEPPETSPLFVACARGHAASVRFLLSSGKLDLLAAMPAALVVACAEGHLPVVHSLLAQREILPLDDIYYPGGNNNNNPHCNTTEDANHQPVNGEDGSFALLAAAESGSVAIVDLLLSAGANVNQRTPIDGVTALFSAVQGGYHDVAALLLRSRADPCLPMLSDGVTPLHLAALHLDLASAQLLLQALPAAQVLSHTLLIPSAERNPFIRAVSAPSKPLLAAILRRLTEAGTDPCAEETTARVMGHGVFLAAKRGHVAMLEQLVSSFPPSVLPSFSPFIPQHPMVAAAGRGHLEVVQYFHAQGWPVDGHALPDHATSLFVASQQGKLAVVNALLQLGADPALSLIPSGTTPLMAACQSGNRPIVAALLQHGGSDVNAAADDGATALHLSVSTGDANLVLLLLDAGADPFLKTADGATPLVLASALFDSYHPLVIELLTSLRSRLALTQ